MKKILQSDLRDYNKTGIQMLLTTINSTLQAVHFRLCTEEVEMANGEIDK